jgi:hypothetical protein
MEGRRSFLKLLGITLCSSVGLASGLNRADSERSVASSSCKGGVLTDPSQNVVGLTSSSVTWRRNIFCQFDHKELREAMEQTAIEADCTIFYGKTPDPDIFACPAFVIIVDRNTVGHDLWKEYVECFDPVGEETPCFIVDNLKHLSIPKRKYVYQFDLQDQQTIPIIVKTVKQMRAQLDQKLPDLFKTSA